jgi:hypothetical protein
MLRVGDDKLPAAEAVIAGPVCVVAYRVVGVPSGSGLVRAALGSRGCLGHPQPSDRLKGDQVEL